MNLVGALDIGGTKTAAALVDETGRIVRRATVATPAGEGAAAVVAAAVRALREVAGAASGSAASADGSAATGGSGGLLAAAGGARSGDVVPPVGGGPVGLVSEAASGGERFGDAARLPGGDRVGVAREVQPMSAGGERFGESASPIGGGPVASEPPVANLVAVGVGAAGVIDPERGVVVGATETFAGWVGADLRCELERAFGVPVVVDNDCHAHAVGELWRGAAVGRRSLLLVAVGTGVGGSWVVDGAVWHGASNVAGHVGHVAVPAAAGVRCTCGGVAHVEAVAAGPAMVAEYRARTGSQLPDLAAVVACADGGDVVARDVLVAGATALGQGVGGLTNVLDPDLVVIAGGVARSGPFWWRALERAWAAELLPALRGRAALRVAELGSDAALIGAARMAWGVAA